MSYLILFLDWGFFSFEDWPGFYWSVTFIGFVVEKVVQMDYVKEGQEWHGFSLFCFSEIAWEFLDFDSGIYKKSVLYSQYELQENINHRMIRTVNLCSTEEARKKHIPHSNSYLIL